MPRSLVFLACWSFVLWLLARDSRKRAGVSSAIWIVVVWISIIASRSVSVWFGFGGAADQAQAYDEGSAIERLVYFGLIGAGGLILSRRGATVGALFRHNKCLVAFFLYWLASALWSDHSFVAFKRWFKDVGNIVMVLVVLTEERPIDAMKTAFVRAACVLIPLSVLFIRFVPDLGRAYHPWSGAMMYTGVATHKNLLGALVLVCGLFVAWDFLDRYRRKGRTVDWKDFAGEAVILTLSVWLLVKANSATSLACGIVGACIFFFTRLQVVQRNIRTLIVLAVAGLVAFWALDSAFELRAAISRNVLVALDRDPTLTGRTDAWEHLTGEVSNPLLGAGYNSFWAGERLRRMWEHYDIIQAHNGYVETYLNGGILGVLFLVAFLLVTARRVYADLLSGGDFARVRLMFLVIGIIYNFTEASFNKLTPVWFAMLLIAIEYPSRAKPAVAGQSRATSESSPVRDDAARTWVTT